MFNTHPSEYRNQLFLIPMACIAVGLSTSVFLMSLGGIGLVVTLFLQSDFSAKLKQAFVHPLVLPFILLYALHLIGLLWTEDFSYAFRDIKVKLPLLLYPLLFFVFPLLSPKQFLSIVVLFIASVLVSTLISYGIYLKVIPTSKDLNDIRNIAPFVSHIRLSLMVCFALVLLAWIFKHYCTSVLLLIGLFAIGLWFLFFLYLIESFTAYAILVVLFSIHVFIKLVSRISFWKKMGLIALLIILLLSGFLGLYIVVKEISTPKESKTNLLPFTPRGEPYLHKLDDNTLENGYYVNLYIADNELRSAWNSRSSYAYDSLGKNKQIVATTLIRYLTSKGLKKDYDAVMRLDESEIRHIENGIANINYLSKNGLYRRIERLYFEFMALQNGENISRNSFVQRLLFWKAGWSIFKQHPLIGVGTGDVQLEFEKEYATKNYELYQDQWKRSHNQILTFLVTFGILGAIVFIYFFFAPLRAAMKHNNTLYIFFWVIVAMSYLSEDTLETQAGITFVMFFTCLLLYSNPHKNPTLPIA